MPLSRPLALAALLSLSAARPAHAQSPTDTISIRVAKGTLLALDIAPDGRIAFDLLGQLWEIGPGGGAARALTDAVRDTAEDADPSYAPDGRRVLPVFTSVAAMGRWDASARPVPADGVRTAVAASADDTDLIVIDPGSESEFVIRRPAVWAIAQGIAWEPAFASPEVFAGLHASVANELAVLDLSVEPGDPAARLRGPELIVRLELMHGLDQAELDAVLARLARRWSTDDRIAVLVDSLTVKLIRA